jgi:WD40 repeat protein
LMAVNKPLKVFEGHSHWVTELVLEKSGCLLYSGGMDKTVRVWDVTNAVCLYVYCGHTDWLSGLSLVFSSTLAADAAACAPSPFHLSHTASTAESVAAPAPDYILSSSHDGSLRFWQPYRPSLRSQAEQACLASFVLPGGGSITRLAACSLGVMCATNFGSVAFLPTHDSSGSLSGGIALSLSSMQLQSTRAHNGPVTALSPVQWLPASALPPGRVTLSSNSAAGRQPDCISSASVEAAPVCFSGGADGCVRMWAVQPLRCLHKYEVGTATGVCCLAFHPRNHLLTVTYDKGETVGWIKETRVPLSIQLAGSVRGVAHAAHGGIVAATSAGVTMYHPTKGARMLQLSAQRCSSLCYVEEAGVAGGRLAFAEDADVLVCSGDALQDAPYDVAVRMGK